MNPMPEIHPDNLLHFLQYNHRGQARTISAARLSEHFGIRERAIREMIAQLRREHHPVCSLHSGFYWPEIREDALPGLRYISQMFKPLREAHDGFLSGLDAEFGGATLFDQSEVA
jgi:hypothetical protein